MDINLAALNHNINNAGALITGVGRKLCRTDISDVDYTKYGTEAEDRKLIEVRMKEFMIEKGLETSKRDFIVKMAVEDVKNLYGDMAAIKIVKVDKKIRVRAIISTRDEILKENLPEGFYLHSVTMQAEFGTMLDMNALQEYFIDRMEYKMVDTKAKLMKGPAQILRGPGYVMEGTLANDVYFKAVNIMPSFLENGVKSKPANSWYKWATLQDDEVKCRITGPDMKSILQNLDSSFFKDVSNEGVWKSFSERLEETLIIHDTMSDKAGIVYALNRNSSALTGNIIGNYLGHRPETLGNLSLAAGLPIKVVTLTRTQTGRHISPIVHVSSSQWKKVSGLTILIGNGKPLDYYNPQLKDVGSYRAGKLKESKELRCCHINGIRVALPAELDDFEIKTEAQFDYDFDGNVVESAMMNDQIIKRMGFVKTPTVELELATLPDIKVFGKTKREGPLKLEMELVGIAPEADEPSNMEEAVINFPKSSKATCCDSDSEDEDEEDEEEDSDEEPAVKKEREKLVTEIFGSDSE